MLTRPRSLVQCVVREAIFNFSDVPAVYFKVDGQGVSFYADSVASACDEATVRHCVGIHSLCQEGNQCGCCSGGKV